MKRARRLNTCPRCQCKTALDSCCGVVFAGRRRWRMSKLLIRRVHAEALGRKGLTDEAYRLRLQAVGVTSCKEFNRQQFAQFMRELARLPDAPRRVRYSGAITERRVGRGAAAA